MPYKMIVPPKEMNSLADIFAETNNLFDAITGEEWSEILFEEEDRELLREAYEELRRESYRFIYDTLRDPSPEVLDGLYIVGLHPDQVQFRVKRRGIRRVFDFFITDPAVGALIKILEFINDLFASIIKVILQSGAWDEIKKVFEKFMKKYEGLMNIRLPVEQQNQMNTGFAEQN